MIFVTGPLYAGKKTFIKNTFGLTEEELSDCAAWNVQELAGSDTPEALADRLSGYRFVIATEVGCGVVPLDPEERALREAAGRLACCLADRADCVIRICCGLPQVLKGEIP